jgi:hypothetical protein
MKLKSLTLVIATLTAWRCVEARAQPQAGAVLWTYQAGTTVQTSPALAADGTVYVIGAGLCAVTNSGSTGSNKWTFPTASRTPAVASDGTIYSWGGSGLFAISSDGSKQWLFPSPGPGTCAAIGFDKTIYFLAAGKLFAVSPSGGEVWEYLIDATAIGAQPPIVGPDGTIYLGLEKAVYAFNRDGTLKWKSFVAQGGYDSPALGAQTIYASAGVLYAFNTTGSNTWATDLNTFSGSPVVGRSLTYATAMDRGVYAISTGGALSWCALTTNNPRYGEYTAPAIDAGGRLYHCVSNSVWCLNSRGQIIWKLTSDQEHDPVGDLAKTSPIIGPDGTIYAALGSVLYAIASGTNGPADSAWPMYRQNAGHTGKVERPALAPPKKRADANFELQLYGPLGSTFTIEDSTNLNTWTSLTSFVATTVPMHVIDVTATSAPSKFYRAFGAP